MHRSLRRRARVPAMLMGLSAIVAGAAGAGPVIAAGDPVAAVQALVDRIGAGELETLDEVVCAEYQEAVRAQFDPTSQLGDLPTGIDLEGLLDSVTIEIAGGSVELLSQDAESAVVRLTGSVTFGLMGFSTTEDVDEEVDVTLEDGDWLVCDDMLGGFSGTVDPAIGASTDGVCAALSVDELNALGEPQFGSSFSGFDSCFYEPSSLEDGYYSLTLLLQGGVLDDFATFYPGGSDLEVAGQRAYAFGDQLWVELEEELLSVQLYSEAAPDATDPQLTAYLQGVAALVVPRVPDIERFDPSSFVPPDIDIPEPGEPGAGIDFCAALPLDELNALSPLQYDQVESGIGSCTYTNSSGTAGFHFVTFNVGPGSVDELKPLFPEGEDVPVAGRAGYWVLEQLWIDDEGELVTVSAFPFGSPGSEDLVTLEYATAVAEVILARLPEVRSDAGGDVH